MHICDVCYTEIKEGDRCDECRKRKSAKELVEEGASDEEIIQRLKELMAMREENIELVTDKLRKMSKKFEAI